jgi:tetratricopeptide (TPR) repeat protein
LTRKAAERKNHGRVSVLGRVPFKSLVATVALAQLIPGVGRAWAQPQGGPDGGADAGAGIKASPAVIDGGTAHPLGVVAAEGYISEVDARVAVAAALGDRLFKLGRYDEAVAEYRRAYELRADPTFLYHIAECYRERGAGEQALFYYKRYLAAKPDAPERAEVLEKIADLDHRNARPQGHPRLTIVPDEPTPKTHAPLRPWRKWWFWTALGAAVAVGVAASLLSGSSDATSPTTDLGQKRFY